METRKAKAELVRPRRGTKGKKLISTPGWKSDEKALLDEKGGGSNRSEGGKAALKRTMWTRTPRDAVWGSLLVGEKSRWSCAPEGIPLGESFSLEDHFRE